MLYRRLDVYYLFLIGSMIYYISGIRHKIVISFISHGTIMIIANPACIIVVITQCNNDNTFFPRHDARFV